LPRLICAGVETRDLPTYGQTGKKRRDRPHAIFQYTLTGEGIFRDAAGTHLVPRGSGFLCESHDPRITYGYPAGKTTPWQFLFVDFAGLAAHVFTHDLIRAFGAIYTIPPDHPALERLLALRVYDKVGCLLPAADHARMVLDLLQALLASKESAPERHPDHVLVKRVHEYIQSRIASRITVSDLAHDLNLSREHLTRVFTTHSGMSPYQHILACKIECACGLLRTKTPPSIKEIATRLGFDHVAPFTRAFKRITRCSPSEFTRLGVLPANTGLRAPTPPAKPA
jgi:AraC-like DNA-binding protein